MIRIALKIIAWTTVFLITAAWGQTEITQLEQAWQEDRFVDLQKLLPQAVVKYPNHPAVLFVQALCENDAERAVVHYNKVYSETTGQDYADAALFRLAQYNYARGRTAVARKLFSFLYQRYPNSRWADDAQYLFAQCYLAEGKLDSAGRFFKKLIKDHPKSLFADLAVADLESDLWRTEEEVRSSEKPRLPQQRLGKGYWTIQVGAFAVRENAVSVLKGLEEVGYHGELYEKQVGNRTFHAVWIGQFKDRAAAEAYAQRFIVKLTKEYHIVRKP